MTDLERIPEPDEYDYDLPLDRQWCDHGLPADDDCYWCDNENARMEAEQSAYYGGLGPLT
jgi:hypothetical protein